MNRTLLSHKKVLVVLGRHSIEDDIKEWLEKGIESVTNIPFMWKIGVLGEESRDVDIGIVTRSDVLNIRLHEANAEFLENVEYCVIIEPSKLISTAQIGLNLIVKKCRSKNEDKNIVFCMFDKNCDGLVDAMSHILMTSISEVSATKKHLGTSSYMSWEADDEYIHHRMVPNISRYLGVGTELSFAGLRNQVSKATWFGGEAFPVTDINWIDRQYYYELMKYAGLPTSQEAMDERFKTTPNYWSAGVAENNYFTVEDENFNMFEILREFATRSTSQGFINVISPEYLLKDYMADNASIFEADPKAIPYIVADYARTERNVTLRLLLMMSTFPVAQETLIKELSLIGIKVFNLKKQLWYEIYKCYADTKSILSLSQDYNTAVEEAFNRTLYVDGAPGYGFTPDIIIVRDRYSMDYGRMETVYSILNPTFISCCAAELKSAGYVAEDEKGEKYYLGSELSGHIYQKYLPGQFFTFGGKYYEMQYLTADGHVLVRRAADHISGRPAYRQIREYEISGIRPMNKIGAGQTVAGMRVTREYADIRVKTSGYYRMGTYKDFAGAKKILFDEASAIPDRIYKNKEILRIDLPPVGDKLPDDIRYTVTVLFNEVFKTLFADNQPFVSAVTCDKHIEDENTIRPVTYAVSGDAVSPTSIYIIEDSQLDLGLTVAVERNLKRIFEIIQDYLAWHAKTLDESLNPPPEPEPPTKPEGDEDGEEKGEKKGFFKRLIEAIKKPFQKIKEWFKNRKKKKGEPEEEVPEGEIVEGGEIADGGAEIPSGDAMDVVESDASEATEETEKKNPFGKIKDWFKNRKKNKGEQEEGEIEEPMEETPVIPEDGSTDAVDSGSDEESSETSVMASVEPKIRFSISYTGPKPPVDGSNDENGEESEVSEEPVSTNEFDYSDIMDMVDEYNSELVSSETEETKTAEEQPTEVFAPIDTYVPEEDFSTAEVLEPVDYDEPETTFVPYGEELPDEPVQSEENAEGEQEIVVTGEEEQAVKHGTDPFERKKYHDRYYLLFGTDGESSPINAGAALDYLTGLGFGVSNPLGQARDGKDIAKQIEATYDPNNPNSRFCDFCGCEILGVEYETLIDGRDRCMSCGRTAIKTEEEFKALFEDVKRNMESFFGIKINAGVRVEMVNSKTLHKRIGKSFVPTGEPDGRVLGVAISDKNGYSLLIENGSPRISSMLTMAHELTHIWQYINWDEKELGKRYGKKELDEIYEGMAKWVEIQYAYLINEPAIAKREEIRTAIRDDEYGRGFLRYREVYPFSTGTVITKPTPFNNVADPLDPTMVRASTATYGGKGKNVPVSVPLNKNENSKGGIVKGIIIVIILLAIVALVFFAFSSAPDADPQENNQVVDTVDNVDTKSNAPLYFYERLDEEKKKAYDCVYNGFVSYTEEVTNLPVQKDKEFWAEIYSLVVDDHPEIDWLSAEGYTFHHINGTVTGLTFNYTADQAQTEARKAEYEAVANKFLATVPEDATDYDKALAVYEYLVNNTDYDTKGLRESEGNSSYGFDSPDQLRNIHGTLVEKKAVCAGYAATAQYLLNRLGIECGIVRGMGQSSEDGKPERHAWNIIKLDGQYYYMDATWGDPSTTEDKEKETDISHDFFAMTTKEMLDTRHNPDHRYQEYVTPCNVSDNSYFVKEGRYLETYDVEKVKAIMLEDARKGIRTEIQFATQAEYKKAYKALVENSGWEEIADYVNSTAGTNFSHVNYITSDSGARVLKIKLV